jgi:hypothetical protein
MGDLGSRKVVVGAGDRPRVPHTSGATRLLSAGAWIRFYVGGPGGADRPACRGRQVLLGRHHHRERRVKPYEYPYWR